MSRSVLVIALSGIAVALLAAPPRARAGGFEYPAPGTRALGRGGAYFARADDPMALLYNPANLASMSSGQLMLNSHVGFFDACYTREGNYLEAGVSADPTIFDSDPDDPGAWALGQDFPEVCNSGPPGVSPDLAYTLRLGPDLGLGFGVVAPAAIGHNIYTDDMTPGTIDGPGGQELPPPGRYVLMEQQLIILYPTVGVGWRPTDWLQVGASLQWGLGFFEFINMTRATGGEQPATDVRSELTASDLFIPAAVVSAHAIPHDNLDIVLSFRWVDDVEATGETTLQYGAYGAGDEGAGVEGPIPTDTLVEESILTAPQPWQLALGIRYADRISPRPRDTSEVERLSGRIEDSMSNERWDIELDVVWEMNSRVDAFGVDLPDDAALAQRDVVPDGMGGLTTMDNALPLPDDLQIIHEWKDQLSIRLGGDYNVIPGMAALRLGGSFETSGLTEPYANLDFIPAQRFGIHAGLTVRLGRFDISLAYAHLFQETITVPACPTDDPETCEDMGNEALEQISADEMGRLVNAGKYEANFDILSLGVTWHI